MIASGMVPIAIGSDTGGSVRQPASFCGLVGLKPTYGAISRHGLISYASSMDTVGIFTNSVIDNAIVYDFLAGHDKRDPTSLRTSHNNITSELLNLSFKANSKLNKQQIEEMIANSNNKISLYGTVIGVPDEFIVEELDLSAREEFERSLHVLQDAGAEIRRVSIPSLKYALPCYYLIACAEASSNLAKYDGIRFGKRLIPDQSNSKRNKVAFDLHAMISATRGQYFGPEVIKRILTGTFVLCRGSYDDYYGKATLVRKLIQKEISEVYEKQGIHLLASLTTPILPFSLNDPPDGNTLMLNDYLTVSANLTGNPAISVPVGTVKRNSVNKFNENMTEILPIGLQLFGPKFGELQLLKASLAIEQRVNFTSQVPNYVQTFNL